jgi:Tfp pilus assembly protein PilE
MIKSNKGYTIIESVIAMLLVALIVSGVFSSVMAARRTIAEPTSKEDMSFAMESVYNKLKASVNNPDAKPFCGGSGHPLDVEEHSITCLLPAQCSSGSTFKYTVSEVLFTTKVEATAPPEIKLPLPYVFFEAECIRISNI